MATDRARAPGTTTIGVKEGVALYVASVLGGGVLTLPSLVAAVAGPASILSWIAVTILSLPLAVMFGRLSATFPDAGGMSSFVARAYGRHPGNVTAWLYLSIVPIAQPAIAMTGLYYVAYLHELSRGWIVGLAYLMLCVAITVGLLGKRLNARVQAWTVLATASIIVAASLLGFGQMEPGHFAVVFPHGYWAVGSAAGLIVWCYVGVENLSFISSDFRNPGRDVLRSILVGTAAVAGLYLAAGVAVIGVLAPDEWGVIKAPFVHVLSRVLGAGFASAAVLTSLGITFASAITIAWGGSNLCSSMAERGSLPAWLAERTDRGVARRAMLFIWALYSLAMAAIYYCDLDLSRLAQVVGAAVLVTYVLSALAYVRLLERDRWSATLTLAGSLGLMPFLGGVMLYPLGILAAYGLYVAGTAAGRRRAAAGGPHHRP